MEKPRKLTKNDIGKVFWFDDDSYPGNGMLTDINETHYFFKPIDVGDYDVDFDGNVVFLTCCTFIEKTY